MICLLDFFFFFFSINLHLCPLSFGVSFEPVLAVAYFNAKYTECTPSAYPSIRYRLITEVSRDG